MSLSHRSNIHRLLILSLLLCTANYGVAQSPDATVSIRATRESVFTGGFPNWYVYVNDAHIGTLTNGETATFVAKASSNNRYSIEFRDYMGGYPLLMNLLLNRCDASHSEHEQHKRLDSKRHVAEGKQFYRLEARLAGMYPYSAIAGLSPPE